MRTPVITIFGCGARRITRRTRGLSTIAVVAAVALVAASCGDSDSPAGPTDTSTTVDDSTTTSTSSTTTTTTTTTTTPTTAPLTLEEQIVANMQGAQREYLDFWGGTDLEDVEVAWFHRGDWASEVTNSPWPPDRQLEGRYCERGTYDWSVADATSESEFTIHYDPLIEDPDCAAFGFERLTAVFTGSREVDGRIVYDFGYTAGLGTPDQPFTGTRTVCSDQWNDAEPCGLPDPGSVMSTPPN